MIIAVVFDLDGTLVKTERLKAISYAKAIRELCPFTVTEEEGIEAFKDAVGLPRREAALVLMEKFKLDDLATQRMDEFGVSEPWQAFVQVRLRYYNALLADDEMIRSNQWEHNVALLRLARQKKCTTALATMSHREQVNRVLDILDFHDQFDFVATRDDVEHGKPNPEIYLLVSRQIGVPPEQCLVIEDSPSGVKAAQAAGMHVIAVTTPFTKDALHEQKLLPERYIIDDPATLLDTVRDFTPVISG